MKLKVFSVGWEPSFIDELLTPIARLTGIEFTHGLVGDASRLSWAGRQYPQLKFVALSKTREEPLPSPDYELLASLESVGVPTVRNMIRGDRVLRYRSETEAFGYATLLALKLQEKLEELQPDVVLASHDSMHSAMSLAVAKSKGIPWVALAFPVIPDNLTGFCLSLTPDSLVPLVRPVDEQIRLDARKIIRSVGGKELKVVAYRAPASLSQWLRQYLLHAKNLLRRRQSMEAMGIDRFTYPSVAERMRDVARRTFNRVRLPVGRMLQSPPDARYVYFPFHMAPESMLDTWAPFYQNQLEFVTQLSGAIPADTDFVIKLHFSDPDNYSRRQLMQLMKLPRLHIAHPSAAGNLFVDEAALVVGIQGTTCLEAALRGKPVLIFGDSPYLHFPRTERAKRPDELHGQIVNMLDRAPATDEEIEHAYANYLARYMPGRINDWSNPLDQRELRSMADCFIALGSYIEDRNNRSNWYLRPPFLLG
ncbi:MAG: hypothetical protein KDI68_05855 [Gammaproteobacteria bacterium]|nr:hypothetical protein [Gammaproteobacteria bacterium]